MHTRGRTLHFGSSYDILNRILFLGQEDAFREFTLGLAGIEGREEILDIGCGTGTLTILVGQKLGPRGKVCGLDTSEEMIKVARKKAKKAGLDVDFRIAAVEDMPFSSDEFDVVLSSLMFHHLPVPIKGAAISEISRVLKAGARFILVDFDVREKSVFGGIADVFFGKGMIRNNLTNVERCLIEEGFVDIERNHTGFLGISSIRAALERKDQ